MSADSKSDPAWLSVYKEFNIISPWSVGRYVDDNSDKAFVLEHILPDMQFTKALGIDYLPVIFPGFSWRNLKGGKLNQIPRQGGAFFWSQVRHRMQANVAMMYGAMFDECDEGTALFKLSTTSAELPAGAELNYLNIDGKNLPDDFYLKLTGLAQRYLYWRRIPPRDIPSFH